MNILKIAFLFLAVLHTIVILTKMKYKNEILGIWVFLLAIGLVGFITLQFNLI